MKKALVVLAAVLVVLAGCGGGGTDGGDPGDPGSKDKEVTVTFLYNYEGSPGNGVYKTVEVVKGEKVSKPDDPPREGVWNRLGWFEEYPEELLDDNVKIGSLDGGMIRGYKANVKEAGVKEFNFDAAVEEDCNVYMRWNKVQKHVVNQGDEKYETMNAFINEDIQEFQRYFFYENVYGDVLRFIGGYSNVFEWDDLGGGFRIEKYLDEPLVVGGTEYAKEVINITFSNIMVWEKKSMFAVVTYGGSSQYFKDGKVTPYGDDISALLDVAGTLSIYSYSKDYIEIGEGGFWRPGKYYSQTKKRLYQK